MSSKQNFHIRLTPESIELIRELATRFGFYYVSKPATGLFLEFAIRFINDSATGKYQWYDTESQSFVDPVSVAEQYRNSTSDNN